MGVEGLLTERSFFGWRQLGTWRCFKFVIEISCLARDNGEVYGQIFSALALPTLG